MIDPTTAFLLVLPILLSIFYILFSNHPTKAPCPDSYPIIGNLPGLLCNIRRFHDWAADMLSSTPSSTIHVKSFLNLSNGICTANPENIEHMLVTNFTNYVKGSRYHTVLEELLGNGIFNVDNELWSLQRKIASHEFSTNSLKHFISETVSSEVSSRLIPFLTKVCKDDKVIDLQDVLQRFSFDNICNVAFGVDPGCLDSEDNTENSRNDMSFVKAFDYAVEHCSSRFLSPLPIIWKVKRFLNLGSEKKFKDAIKLINNFAMNIITLKEKDVNHGTKNQDLLSRFMHTSSNIQFQSQEHKRKFLRDIVISFILAGKDSTSTALTWFFWLISGHSDCTSKIQAEIKASPPGTFIYDDLKSFHYLHAALSETLRLFPPVPIDSRLTVHDDVFPDGTRVYKGWFADYSAYAVGRNEKVWGPDCREFKPARWLDDHDGRFKPSDVFKFPVFHAGPRMCLGRDMAYVQMKCVVAAVMKEFEIVAVDGGASVQSMVDPPYRLSLVLKMRGGFKVKVRRLEN